MSMSVRLAVPSDKAMFRFLWQAYLDETARNGSPIVPDETTMDFYLGLFDRYTSDPDSGVVAVWYSLGVSMAGDVTPPYSTLMGKTANGWGTYIDPKFRGQNRALTLRSFVIDHLRSHGYNTLLGTESYGDDPAHKSLDDVEGLERFQTIVRLRL